MRARTVAAMLCAGVALTACGIAAVTPPTPPAGTGTAGFVPTVTFSVVACEPFGWCVAAGTDPTATTGTSGVELSPGGRGSWGRVAVPPLPGVTLTAAGCWASGCLLGGQGPGGSVDVIVNPRHRDASFSGPMPGTDVTAITCVGPGHCLALVSTSAETLVVETTTSGSSWRQLAVLPDAVGAAVGLSCSTPTRCVAVGIGPHGASAERTVDGGVRWRVATRPGGLESFTSVACATSSWCLATARTSRGTTLLLQSVNGGGSWRHVGTRVAAPDAVSCANAATCLVAGGDATGGALSVRGLLAHEQVLSLLYVPEPIVELACASPLRCAGITEASTVSLVP